MTNGSAPPVADDVLKRSVTRDDYNKTPQSGVYHWIIPSLGSAGVDLPAFWSFARDAVLSSLVYRESMWAAAVSIAISKIVSQDFEVNSDVPLRSKRAQDLFLNFDSGRGYVSGLQKHLMNFIHCGNGAHVEIVRATRALGSRIIGLVPLDSFRCKRTGDPDFPIIYRDRRGAEHVMREWDVMSITDMPDPADTWYGVGHCAAERAYKAIIKLEAIEQYIHDKVTGQRALAFHIVGGVKPADLENAKLTAQSDAQARGVTNYLGAVMVAMMGDTPASLVTIPLAELPDGFNRKEEWDISLVTYARSLGIAVQDLQPLTGQAMGTGAQTQVLDEAAKGEGLAAWRKAWVRIVNEYALDDRTTYAILTPDMRDKEREAKVRIDESAAIMNWYNMSLTPEQAINLGVDRGQLPEEYRPKDLTPGSQLEDDEKPVQEQSEADVAPPEPADTQRPTAPAKATPGTTGTMPNIKEFNEMADMVRRAEKAAQAAENLVLLVTQKEARAVREQQKQETAEVIGLLKSIKEQATVPEPAPPPEMTIHIPPIPAPVVNVAPPEVHVAAPVVNVPAPVVNIPAPIIHVAAPDVHVPAPVVIADPATAEAIESLAAQLETRIKEQGRPRKMRVLKRDEQGRVAEWEEK